MGEPKRLRLECGLTLKVPPGLDFRSLEETFSHSPHFQSRVELCDYRSIDWVYSLQGIAKVFYLQSLIPTKSYTYHCCALNLL
jgi:hypothetical protein